MKSFTSRRFRALYAELPEDVRLRARHSYRQFLQHPSHPGLNFKKLGGHSDVYLVRIGRGYRALGRVTGEEVVWFWIGSHADYDQLLAQ